MGQPVDAPLLPYPLQHGVDTTHPSDQHVNKVLDVPVTNMEYWYKSHCTSELVLAKQSCDDVSFNALGLPYRCIAGGAYPPSISRGAVDRLRQEWAARADDVFLAFPSAPLSDGFLAFSVALVEQCAVDKVDLALPRWLEEAVSRRDWSYVDDIDAQPTRRCLTTAAPPWRFPGRNFSRLDFCGRSSSAPSTASESSGTIVESGSSVISDIEPELPRVAVFVADPRFMVMKELQTALTMARSNCRRGNQDISLIDLLRAHIENDRCDTRGVGVLGNAVRNTTGWARAELQYPERIRLFFTEDFILQPEVAMRGLASFLNVPAFTLHTEAAVREAVRLPTISHMSSSPDQPQHLADSLQNMGVQNLVADFERQLAGAPQEVQVGWASIMDSWLHSANSRMAAYACAVLQHEAWAPPCWWVAHNARICRPCIFFPRGKCDDEYCDFCHGEGHAKPKRTPKAKRASRRRFDRTPSP